jgi:hypothetical protein
MIGHDQARILIRRKEMQLDFLLCSERSGSNLITKIIDGHSTVCGPFPSHMMRTFCPQYYLYGDLAENQNWIDLTEDVTEYLSSIFAQWESSVSAEEIRTKCPERTLANIIRLVYEKEAKTRGKQRVFLKENHTYQFIPFILTNFSEARFVWVVRDPRDMALCQRDSILPGGVQTAVVAWKTDQAESLKIYGYLKDVGRILLVKFEKMIRYPEDTIRQVCDFLDLPYESGMLEFYKNENVIKNAGAISAWTDIAKPIKTDNFNNYKIGLSEIEIRFVEAFCYQEMRLLGYELEYKQVGDVEDLQKALPAESIFNHTLSEFEATRLGSYFEMLKRLKQRWSNRIVHLNITTRRTNIDAIVS